MNTKIGSFILVALVFFVLVAFSYVVSVNAQSSATTTIPSSIIVDDTTPPLVTINLPVDGALYNFANFPLLFNVTLNENGSVEYSLNSGDHNFTMSSDVGSVFGVEFNATNSSMADGPIRTSERPFTAAANASPAAGSDMATRSGRH